VTARLTFAPGPHKYRLDGEPVPSVTQVLNSEMPGWQAGEWYLQRGIVVHACAAHIARDQEFALDLSDQTPEDRADIEGRIEACRRFFREMEPHVLAVEYRVFSARHRYAGTLDLFGRDGKGYLLLDWKCGPHITTCWQLGGYAHALKSETGVEVRRGRGVTLNDDGTYNETEDYDLRRYATEWQWILGVYRIKKGMK
jgi:hypothetical protein